MRLQFLVSTVNENVETLAERMNLQADAIVVNQCDRNEYREYTFEGNRIRCYSFAERGVGLSRNNCLMRADGDLCLFADEDIIYRPGAAKAVIGEFEKNPEADMILFNVDVPKERRTYHIDSYGRVRWYSCGRYDCRIHKRRISRRDIHSSSFLHCSYCQFDKPHSGYRAGNHGRRGEAQGRNVCHDRSCHRRADGCHHCPCVCHH